MDQRKNVSGHRSSLEIVDMLPTIKIYRIQRRAPPISSLFPASLVGVTFDLLILFHVYLIYLFYLLQTCQYFEQVNLSRSIAIASGEYVCNTCRNRSLRNIISIRCVSLGEGQRGKKAAKHCEGLQNGARKIRDRRKVVGREECSLARTLVVV